MELGSSSRFKYAIYTAIFCFSLFTVGNISFYFGFNKSVEFSRHSLFLRDLGRLELYHAMNRGTGGNKNYIKFIEGDLDLQLKILELEEVRDPPIFEKFIIKFMGRLTAHNYNLDYEGKELRQSLKCRYEAIKGKRIIEGGGEPMGTGHLKGESQWGQATLSDE